ncbi:MAG: helix-turn-helix domain-containing protein [Ruminococcus flavefaciens]|nr:helix-turn-helix domain-containing protein [Eubacterium sp.]MCM1236917.1 helix-turn-helix domain-containing protein [Ruminococcus flavefaciens]
MSIGECIKTKRIAFGYSQDRLAKIVGIGQPMMAQIERGTKVPNMLLGKSIAEALGCKIEELYGED